jgi:hypothetical protein
VSPSNVHASGLSSGPGAAMCKHRDTASELLACAASDSESRQTRTQALRLTQSQATVTGPGASSY